MTTFQLGQMTELEINDLIREHIVGSWWNFSGDMRAAMRVVQAVIDAGFEFHLSFTDETGEPCWEARISEKRKRKARNDMRQIWVAFNVELPRAICEASLRWSGKVEDPE